MKGKSAQITLFMLIGVVILGGAALTYHAVQVETKMQLERKAEEVSQQLLKTTALEEYITLCLKEATEKGIGFLGKQGGVIYKSQDGTTPDYGAPLPYGLFSLPLLFDDEFYDVSYSLKEPILSPTNQVNPPPPKYPYAGPLIPQQPHHLRDSHFGNKILKPLCDPKGPNQVGAVLYRSCETYGPPKSIQEELRDYVTLNLEGCVDFEEISSIIGYNITEGKVNSNITFTENTIVVDAYYPISMVIRDKPVSKVMQFKTELPIRLKTIHEFLDNLLQKETNDLFFNVSRDYKNFTNNGKRYWTPGLSLVVVKDPCSTCIDAFGAPFDDILIISDEESRYQGEVFQFAFAIKNRIPVLDLIHTPNSYPDFYDVVIIENSTLKISPQGYDPDEDELTYHYSMWKADYDEEFAGPHPEDIFKIVPPVYGFGNQWEQSSPYIETSKDAEIEVGERDIGVHILNVSVEDDQGLTDWQEVRVLVNDMPDVDLQSSNQFQDISNKYASIEDPYKLDGSGTVAFFQKGMVYNFLDSLEKQGIFSSGISPIVFIPDENPDISDMLPYMFTVEGTHLITLTVSDNMGVGATGFGSDSIEIEVRKCLPHRNQNTASYPFNNIDNRKDGYTNVENPFQADHTCCSGTGSSPGAQDDLWGNYMGTDKACYSGERYGCLSDFADNGFRVVDIPDYLPKKNYISYGDYSNDVHKIQYRRYCDGKRGNTCKGEQRTDISLVKACHDKCQTCSLDDENCRNLPSTTLCDDRWQCSTGDGGAYPGTGPNKCQGYCSDGDCTVAGNCECSTGCGAECDSTNNYLDKIEGNYFVRYECDLKNCKWKQQPAIVCELYQKCNEYGQDCSKDNQHDFTKKEWCFSNPYITGDSAANYRCSFNLEQEMSAGRCGYCTEEGDIAGGSCPSSYYDSSRYCNRGCLSDSLGRCTFDSSLKERCSSYSIWSPYTYYGAIYMIRVYEHNPDIYGEECRYTSGCSQDGCVETTEILHKNSCDVCTAEGIERGEYCFPPQPCQKNCDGNYVYEVKCDGTKCAPKSSCKYIGGFIGSYSGTRCVYDEDECDLDCSNYIKETFGSVYSHSGFYDRGYCSCTYQKTITSYPRKKTFR